MVRNRIENRYLKIEIIEASQSENARMSLPSVRQASAQEDERWGVPERTECQNRKPIECQNYEEIR